jgi:hypothetical protein
MDQGQGIAFDVQATEQIFAKLYPQQYASTVGTNQLFADARQRWQNSMNAFQQTLVVQAQVARNVEADSDTLSSLVNASQGAVGNLQAQQAMTSLGAGTATAFQMGHATSGAGGLASVSAGVGGVARAGVGAMTQNARSVIQRASSSLESSGGPCQLAAPVVMPSALVPSETNGDSAVNRRGIRDDRRRSDISRCIYERRRSDISRR